MRTIEGLYYTENHEWVRVEGSEAFIGITDFAQCELGDIVYVELPEAGASFREGEAFGTVESVKAASDIYLPVSGTVTKVNDAVSDDPALVNQDAFENWMICIEMSNPEELEKLMDAVAYEKYCSEVE